MAFEQAKPVENTLSSASLKRPAFSRISVYATIAGLFRSLNLEHFEQAIHCVESPYLQGLFYFICLTVGLLVS